MADSAVLSPDRRRRRYGEFAALLRLSGRDA